MDIILNNKYPKYLELFTEIKKLINNNTLKGGEKLPSKRTLSADLNVSINTVINAYNLLLDEGYIYSIEKSGYYVTKQPAITISNSYKYTQIANDNNIIYDFSTANVNNFNCKNYNKVMKDVLLEENYLNKTNLLGDISLRLAIKNHLAINRNINVSENQIIIGSGMEMIENILPLCNINNITLENPGYHKLEYLFKNKNYSIKYQDLDNEGVIPPQERTILYTTPFNQFPTGIKMTISRKKELADFGIKTNSYIIEDDFDAEFRINGSPTTSIISLIPNNVIFFSTFSTTLFPGLRIAYIILPFDLINKYTEKYKYYSNTVPTLNQISLARFISEGYYATYLNKKKREYLRKRNLIINQLNQLNIPVDEKRNYLSLVIKLDIKDHNEFKEKLKKEKIRIYSYTDYDKYEKESNYYLLGYTSIDDDKLLEGINKLNELRNC